MLSVRTAHSPWYNMEKLIYYFLRTICISGAIFLCVRWYSAQIPAQACHRAPCQVLKWWQITMQYLHLKTTKSNNSDEGTKNVCCATWIYSKAIADRFNFPDATIKCLRSSKGVQLYHGSWRLRHFMHFQWMFRSNFRFHITHLGEIDTLFSLLDHRWRTENLSDNLFFNWKLSRFAWLELSVWANEYGDIDKCVHRLGIRMWACASARFFCQSKWFNSPAGPMLIYIRFRLDN